MKTIALIVLAAMVLAGCASTGGEVFRYEPEKVRISGLTFTRAGIVYGDTLYYYGTDPAMADTLAWEDMLFRSKRGSIYRILRGLDIYVAPGDSMTLSLGRSWRAEQ